MASQISHDRVSVPAEQRYGGPVGGQRVAEALLQGRVDGAPCPVRGGGAQEDGEASGDGLRGESAGRRGGVPGRGPDQLPAGRGREPVHPHQLGVPDVVRVPLRGGHLRERDEVVQHGAGAGARGLHGPGRHDGVRQVQRHRRARPQRVLGPAEPAARVGAVASLPAAAGGGVAADPLRHVALRRPGHRLGRGQREPALQLLRGTLRLGRVHRLLRRRAPAGHRLRAHVLERVQHAGAAGRHGRAAGQVPAAPAADHRRLPGERRRHGHRPRGPLHQAQHPLHARRARHTGAGRHPRLAHRGRRRPRPVAGAAPGGGAAGGVRAPGGAGDRHLVGVAAAGVLRHVPHRQQLQEPAAGGRRGPPHRRVAGEPAGRRHGRAGLLRGRPRPRRVQGHRQPPRAQQLHLPERQGGAGLRQ